MDLQDSSSSALLTGSLAEETSSDGHHIVGNYNSQSPIDKVHIVALFGSFLPTFMPIPPPTESVQLHDNYQSFQTATVAGHGAAKCIVREH